jgi:RHS repeat-associated protein
VASSTTLYSLTNLTHSGNSDVLTATDSINGTWSSYTYDDFNRLISSTCSAACPQGTSSVAFSYTYDRYGNRWQQTLTEGAGSWPQPSYSFNANNQISASDGITFDAAGNIVNDTIHTYTYDAENRIVQVDTGSTAVYAYDAEGRRVAKTAATAGGAFEYLFDLQGRAVTELGAGTKNVNRSEIYGAGRHLATQNVGLVTTYFMHNDWLGSKRVSSSLSGTLAQTCQSLPYGDVLNCSGAQTTTLHFTGQMRDAETELTEFPARYYSPAQGRWYSPDWASAQVPVPYADLHNPQTLNLYDYVGGDPTNHADADGHALYMSESSYDAELISANDEEQTEGQADEQRAQGQAQNNNNQQTQENQSQSNSSDGVKYKPGIPPAKDELEKVLKCTQSCTGKEFTVTSTNEAVKGHSDIHQPNTPHGRGEAADIRLPGGKADVGKALQCAANCGAKAAFDEYNHPSPHATGPHLHIQTVPTKSGGRGDLPEPED